MKNRKIFLIVIFLLLVFIVFLGILWVRTDRELKNNKTVYCVMTDNESKMEIYFDFKEGQLYRYSVISTNPFTDDINVDGYNQIISKSNDKYKGATGKFWTDHNIYITTEFYDLDLLTEEEFKELTALSKKELQLKTRKEIIESMIPMGDNGDFKCS